MGRPWFRDDHFQKETTPIKRKDKIVAASIQKHGVQHWGPVSKEKLDCEIHKHSTVYTSIREKGFIYRPYEEDGVIRGSVLEKNDGQWVWLPLQGQHRLTSAVVLGYSEVAVRIDAVIRERDADIFPQVLNGCYTPEEAHTVFSRYFNPSPVGSSGAGQRPKILSPWYGYLRSQADSPSC